MKVSFYCFDYQNGFWQYNNGKQPKCLRLLTYVLGIINGYMGKTRFQFSLIFWWRETEKKLTWVWTSPICTELFASQWCSLWPHYSDIAKGMYWIEPQGLNSLQWLAVKSPWKKNWYSHCQSSHKEINPKTRKEGLRDICQSLKTKRTFSFSRLGTHLDEH